MKKVISVVASAVLMLLAYYGSYLPLRKSQFFISAMEDIRSVTSVQEFEDRFSVPLNAPSPIGQEELVRNFANFALSTVQRAKRPELGRAISKYVDAYYAPIIARGRGMSFNQNLYVLGAWNEVVYVQTRDPAYLTQAKKYFEQSLELGPFRPQALYGLFDIYRLAGDAAGATAIGQRILDQWPTDARTAQALKAFLAAQQPKGTKQR